MFPRRISLRDTETYILPGLGVGGRALKGNMRRLIADVIVVSGHPRGEIARRNNNRVGVTYENQGCGKSHYRWPIRAEAKNVFT